MISEDFWFIYVYVMRHWTLNILKNSTGNTFEVVLLSKGIPFFTSFVSVLHQGKWPESTINIWYCYIAFWYSKVKTFLPFFKMRNVWCYEWVLCILFFIFMLCMRLWHKSVDMIQIISQPFGLRLGTDWNAIECCNKYRNWKHILN